MDLKDIIAIGGKPGLFKFISQAKNGIIVENLKDQKRTPSYATDKVSALDDIAVFTEDEEVSLAQVLVNIFKKEEGKVCISHKSSSDELKNYFAEILPDYDKERVYVSDIKKILSWYNILQELNMVDGEIKKEDDEAKDDSEVKKEKESDSKEK